MKRRILFVFLSTSCSPQFAETDFDAIRPIAISQRKENFNDLTFLKDLLKSKRIVILGEDVHQNGSGIKLHHRIIKFLTTEMGFGKILFESDMYPIWRGLDCYQKGMDARKVATEFGPAFHFRQDEWSILYEELLGDTNVSIGGYDIGYDAYFSSSFVNDVKRLVDGMARPLSSRDSAYFVQFATDVVGFKLIYGEVEYSLDRIMKISDLVVMDIQSRTKPSWAPIYVQFIRNNVGFLRWAQSPTKRNKKDLKKFYKERDVQMAKNILWWLRTYPNDKFIIHCADYHAARHLKFAAGVRTMVDLLTDSIPETEMYSLANITYGGYFGYKKDELKVRPKMRRSVESVLHNKKFEHVILDFDEVRMYTGRRFIMQSLEPLVSKRRRWGRAYDGFLFIDEAAPFTTQVIPDSMRTFEAFNCD